MVFMVIILIAQRNIQDDIFVCAQNSFQMIKQGTTKTDTRMEFFWEWRTNTMQLDDDKWSVGFVLQTNQSSQTE